MTTTLLDRVTAQLQASGYQQYVIFSTPGTDCLRGMMDLAVLPVLSADPRFKQDPFWQLHADVGDCLTEFRSIRGTFGKGSMQLVIDQKTGRFYADVDEFSPNDDVVGVFGHLFGEVIFGPLFGWLKRKVRKA